jgi:hypothetical protein
MAAMSGWTWSMKPQNITMHARNRRFTLKGNRIVIVASVDECYIVKICFHMGFPAEARGYELDSLL